MDMERECVSFQMSIGINSNDQTKTKTMTTIFKTSLKEIFTPKFDPSTGGKYNGNHMSFAVIFQRTGDKLKVRHFGCKGLAPVAPLLSEINYIISDKISEFQDFATEQGLDFHCFDNIPEGHSFGEAI